MGASIYAPYGLMRSIRGVGFKVRMLSYVVPGEPGRLVGIYSISVWRDMPPRIPEEARHLIVRHIHSVAQLELLLYLRGLEGETATAASVAKEQRIGTDMASDILADLTKRGFAIEKDEGGFAYRPSPTLAQHVDALADAYSTFRVTIINLIFSKPSESVQSFADAFRVRREED